MKFEEYIVLAIKSAKIQGGDAEQWVICCNTGSNQRMRFILDKSIVSRFEELTKELLGNSNAYPSYGDGGISRNLSYEDVIDIRIHPSGQAVAFIVRYKAVWFLTSIAKLAGVDYETITS